MSEENQTLLYLDCRSGVSGDMTVAALLDLGIDTKEFTRQLDALGLPGYRVEIGRRESSGISACDFNVVTERHEHVHRNLSDIEEIIRGSDLPPSVVDRAMAIFLRLARAEAAVHGVSVEEIHFHEVGAVDAIVDIVSASICLEMLAPSRVVVSPIPFGTGFVKCAHGMLPVPVPATVRILAERGAPVYQTEIAGELVTPTGAAIVATIADEFGQMPAIELRGVGYGAGKKVFERPNVLRTFIGSTRSDDSQVSEISVLETNIDDMNPEIYSYVVPLLLENGALDVYMTNVIMKKGRPGTVLNVVCRPESEAELAELIMAQTTTLGVRIARMNRLQLSRKSCNVETRYGAIRAKEIIRHGAVLRRVAEYEECRRIASERGISIREVYDRLNQDLSMPEAT